MEAYGWFVTGGLHYQAEEVWVEGDSSPWHQVDDSRFPDYQSFYRYLTGIFPQEMVDGTLLAGGNYRELDGKLYTRGNIREKNRFIGGADYALVSETDSRREIMATAYLSRVPRNTFSSRRRSTASGSLPSSLTSIRAGNITSKQRRSL